MHARSKRRARSYSCHSDNSEIEPISCHIHSLELEVQLIYKQFSPITLKVTPHMQAIALATGLADPTTCKITIYLIVYTLIL